MASVSDPNPLLRPDVWSLQASGASVPVSVYVSTDQPGDAADVLSPLVNSAGDPIVGEKTRRAEITMTVRGNRSASPFSLATDLVNRTNFSTWANGAARTWLCTGISGEQAAEIVGDNLVEYWKTSFSFTYNADTWDKFIPDVGLNYLSGGVKRRVMVEDSDGNYVPSPKPQPLNSDGSVKTSGEADLLRRQIYRTADFSSYFGAPPV
jgi:hypothetical protein